MLDDSNVVGECCFFGCIVHTKRFPFAINTDLCCEPLPTLGHSSIPTGVSRRQFSFLAAHSFCCLVLSAVESSNCWESGDTQGQWMVRCADVSMLYFV